MNFLSRGKGILNILAISCLFALVTGGYLNGMSILTVIAYFAIVGLFIYYIIYGIKPSKNKNPVVRLRIMNDGRELMIVFAWAFVFNIIMGVLWKTCFHISTAGLIVYCIAALLLNAGIIVNSFIRIFTTSKQLGIIWRVVSILCWWVPILNVYLMLKASVVVKDEYSLETAKNELDEVRKESEICKTKYPLLMVHGVFFRDLRFFNYWGRIPKELIRNGAEIYYGNQQSAASVQDCAQEIKSKIESIIKETGCEKVNVIAHSKGGLDTRYAISHLGVDKYVATLTTINTPHRGCAFADYLLGKISAPFKYFIAARYNSTLRRLGDSNPDFIAAVSDLTVENCMKLNETTPDMPEVYYQSVGAKMRNRKSAFFPLNITYTLIEHFTDAGNDGLVDVESMKWGSRHKFYEPQSERGISHGDMIDLLREDIKGFDVREVYVQLVKELKDMGY